MFLSQNGTIITNNSGIINDEPLFCFTDHKNCCSSDTAIVTGNWFFPNGSVIGKKTTSHNIYIERGWSVVGLYWNDSTTIPTGVYQCEILDATGILRNVFVGIYSAQDSTSNSSEFEVVGAVVGVLLTTVLLIAVSVLVVVFGKGRLAQQ